MLNLVNFVQLTYNLSTDFILTARTLFNYDLDMLLKYAIQNIQYCYGTTLFTFLLDCNLDSATIFSKYSGIVPKVIL